MVTEENHLLIGKNVIFTLFFSLFYSEKSDGGDVGQNLSWYSPPPPEYAPGNDANKYFPPPIILIPCCLIAFWR